MPANAFVPHLAASVAPRCYAPGMASGLLLNLSIGAALLAAIALLFALGRTFTARVKDNIHCLVFAAWSAMRLRGFVSAVVASKAKPPRLTARQES